MQRSDGGVCSEVDASVRFVSSFLLDVSFTTFKPLEKSERFRSGFTFTRKDSLYFMSTVSGSSKTQLNPSFLRSPVMIQQGAGVC